MKELTWRVASLDDGWAELRAPGFLFLVPLDQLPSGVEAGEALDAQGGSQQTGYPVFRRESGQRRRATA